MPRLWCAPASKSRPSALSLAADFLEENRELDPELRRATEARLVGDLESDDPARRLAAEVQLTRRLRSLQQIDDRREIDLKFITCAEYQLFLAQPALLFDRPR